MQNLRTQLHEQQFCVLPVFLLESARATAVKDTLAAMNQGYRNTSTRNCYLQRKSDPKLPSEHPCNLIFNADQLRLMGVFVFENEPGVIGDPQVNETVNGPRVNPHYSRD